MNKRGQILEIWIFLFTLALVGYALYTLVTGGNKITTEVSSPLELLNVHSEAREKEFYLHEAAKFSSQQTSFLVLDSLKRQDGCELSNKNVIWSDSCKPNTAELEKKFVDFFREEFFPHVSKYEKTFNSFSSKILVVEENLNKENLNFLLDGNELRVIAEKDSIYTLAPVKIEVNPSISVIIPFPILELEEMYKQSKAAASSCKSVSESEIVKCVQDKIKLEHFDIQARKVGNFLFFEATTTSKFLYKDPDPELKFEKLRLNYAFSLK